MAPNLEEVRAASFADRVGETFLVYAQGVEALPLTLLEVKEVPAARPPLAPPEQRIPFSLVFRGAPLNALFSTTATLDHQALGRLAGVFINRIVPLDTRAQDAFYEVCIG
jgi:hypothetical protein